MVGFVGVAEERDVGPLLLRVYAELFDRCRAAKGFLRFNFTTQYTTCFKFFLKV